MKIDQGVILAAGRHVVTAAATAAAVLVGVGMMSPEQSAATIDSVKQLTHGVQEITTAVCGLAATGMAVLAAFKASPLAQMLSVAKRPEVAAIVTVDKAVAEAVPSEKVVAPQQAQPIIDKAKSGLE